MVTATSRTKPKPKPKQKAANLTVKRMALARLKPHPRNPREHPKAGSDEYEALRGSLRHDYFDPLVYNTANGMLVSGHLRRKILMDDGFTHADVVVKRYTESEHVARMIAANKVVGEYKMSELKDLLQEIDTGEFSMELTGYNDEELKKLMSQYYIPPEPEGDGENGMSEEPPDLPPAQIRMVQLFLTVSTFPVFEEWCKDLGEHFKTENITDTVWRAMEHAHHSLKVEAGT